MKALIIYDTLYGNTKQIAEAIADGLREQYDVQTIAASDTPPSPDELDLVLLGGPTHRHGLSDGMRDLLDRWPDRSLNHLPVATFDTRYRGPAWLTGSAAKRIGQMLRRKHGDLVVPPESFFVAQDQPSDGKKRNHEIEQLEPGEAERARDWGARIAALVPAPV